MLVPDGRLQAIKDAWREYQAIQSLPRTLNEQRETETKLNRLLGVHTEEDNECKHKWIDVRNEVVSSGEWCPKCGAVQAGNDE